MEVNARSDAKETSILGFRHQDLKGIAPYNDALIIWTTLANSEITRIFVDAGSLVNILFKEALDRVQLAIRELQPVATSLYGFARNEVIRLGQIHPSLSLGGEPLRQTRVVLFTK